MVAVLGWMVMGMREKLLELIGRVQDEGRDYSDVVCSYPTSNGKLADYLIANDVVQVVRCKDCKIWEYHEINGRKILGKCQHFGRVVKADDFCSYGERKDDATN